MLYSGKLIRNIRTAENIKLTTLARGLCSIGQLARIENGDRSAEKLLFDSLYERLGKYSGRFTVLVNFDEYEQLRKRLYIYKCIDDGKYEEAQRELDRYKKHTRNHIHKQFLCLAECEIMHKTGREINECMYKLMEGISYTFADFEIEHIEEYYLSRMEMLLAQQYVRYLELRGEKSKAIRLYHKIINCLEKERYDRSERDLLYRHVGYWLMNCYIGNGQYQKAMEIGERTYELTVGVDLLVLLAELKEGIIRCREALGEASAEEYGLLATLKRMNQRYGVTRAEKFFPRYREGHAVNVNEVIRQRRIVLGMTQEELAAGICDVTTISRLENKRHKLNDTLRVQLLQRLKLSGDKYISSVDTYDYKVFKKINRLKDLQTIEKYGELKEIINEITDEYKLYLINSKQYMVRVLGSRFVDEYSAEEILRILNLTLPVENCAQGLILFENEWGLFQTLFRFHSKRGEYEEAEKYFSMLKPAEGEPLTYERNTNYIMYTLGRGDLLGEKGLVEAANRDLVSGIRMSVKTDALGWLSSLTYIYAWNVLEKKEHKSDADYAECKEMLEYSYAFFEIYHNEKGKERIKNLRKKHEID